ncbi:unnamed protein product [marine sediment metagenome]|uniref:4Fe-4S ferredoxin-type domain-containing protein n=1 Tax=marine sediment metagenome TaxID=412755 RepID=X1CPG0_9ZZZZ
MSQDKRIKNFKDLIKEVHDKGICQLCGGCVSFCSSADYRIIDFIKPDLQPLNLSQMVPTFLKRLLHQLNYVPINTII